METKEKSRAKDTQRRPRTAGERSAAGTPDNTKRSKTARKTAEQRSADRKKQPERPAPAVKKQRTEKPQSRQTAPRHRAPAQAEREALRRSREQLSQEPVRQGTARQTATSIPRPARENDVRFAAPQGTGPRKSAPTPSAEEASRIRSQQRRQPAKPQEKKKNTLQNFISGIKSGPEEGSDAAARAEKRRKAREERKKKQAQRTDTPAIIYTEPMTFNRDRLLIQLLTVVAVVAAMVVGMSVFFKVETVTVAGAETYSPWAIREASGIKEGDNLLTFSKARAIAKVHAELAYVDNVRIGIKLPDTVIIYIEELDVAYAIESTQGSWWLINSEGRVVEQITNSQSADYTKVEGVKLEDPQPGQNAVAANEIPQETLESGEPVPVTVTGAQRLSAVLQILQALEANDIVGEASRVEVETLEDITLWYGSRYEVLLGEATDLEYKIACMNDAILELSEYQSGILDVSFTHWKDQVGYTPFG